MVSSDFLSIIRWSQPNLFIIQDVYYAHLWLQLTFGSNTSTYIWYLLDMTGTKNLPLKKSAKNNVPSPYFLKLISVNFSSSVHPA